MLLAFCIIIAILFISTISNHAIDDKSNDIQTLIQGNYNIKLYDLSCIIEYPNNTFSTISSCYIQCIDNACENAYNLCNDIKLCNAIVLPSDSTIHSNRNDSKYLNYIVELKSSNVNAIDQPKEQCLAYGKNTLDTKYDTNNYYGNLMNEYKKRKMNVVHTNSTILYLHFRKNSGTTMCELAKINKVIVPSDGNNHPTMRKFASSMGKNCNPGTAHMQAWWGSYSEQVDWVNKYGIQYYGHEVHLPIASDVPFDDFIVSTVLRHPILRLYSLYLEKYGGAIDSAKKSKMVTVSTVTSTTTSKNISDTRNHSKRRVSNAYTNSSSRHPAIIMHDKANMGNRKNGRIDPIIPSTRNKPVAIIPTFKQFVESSVKNQDIAYFTGMNGYVKTKSFKFPNIDMFNIHKTKTYSNRDVDMAISMLEKFTFISIFESSQWMTPYLIKNVWNWKETDVGSHRRGTNHDQSQHVYDLIGRDDGTVAATVSNVYHSLPLYQYGIKLACAQYYYMNVVERTV